jgi:hypothetical protein
MEAIKSAAPQQTEARSAEQIQSDNPQAKNKFMLVAGEWREQTNLAFVLLFLSTVAIVAAIIYRASWEPNMWEWLFRLPPVSTEPVIELATVLGPFVAVALAVERLLESAFDYYEQKARDFNKLTAKTIKDLGWIYDEYKVRRDAVAVAATARRTNPGNTTDDDFTKALKYFEEAQKWFNNWMNGPDYMSKKRAVTIWVGLLLGVLIALFADLQMLATIHVRTPHVVDLVMTGLLIGAGPGPLHSIIGILQSGKDTLAQLADLRKSRAINEVATTVQRAVEATNRQGNETAGTAAGTH